MKKAQSHILVSLLILTGLMLSFSGLTSLTAMAAESGVNKDTRCAVCGMFVAKYPTWICKIRQKNGKTLFFDGPKDMMAYYFAPYKYGGSSQADIKEMKVKDYYSLKWIDAFQSFFVMGSDVYGPMGGEFVPFSSMEAAKAFAKDHRAGMILPFKKITADQVSAMRNGQMMK